MSPLNNHITEQLRKELAASSVTAALTSILLVLFYQFSIFNSVKDSILNWSFSGLLILSLATRYALAKKSQMPSKKWLNYFSVLIFISGACWLIICANVIVDVTHTPESIIMTYVIIAGLIASGAYTLSISKRDFFVFEGLLLAVILFGFNQNEFSMTYRVSGTIIVLLFLGFLIRQRKLREDNWTQTITLNYELQKVMDMFPGGVAVLKNGKYERINQYIKDVLMTPEERAIDPQTGRYLGDRVGRTHHYVKKINEFLNSPLKRTQFEMELDVDRTPHTHVITASKVSHDEIVVAAIDIQSSKEIKSKLENSAKMAALGEMSGGLAHEINTPLAIISVRAQHLLQMVSEGVEIPKDQMTRSLENIDNTAIRISKIIKGLKSFARDVSNDPFEIAQLNVIAEDTKAFCDARFKNKGVNFKVEIPEDLKISCRPTQISQVILNALNNSFDAIQGLPEKWIELKAEQVTDHIKITITDSGKGIPLEVQDKVMQPFFTTKDVGKGTGLGLSLSRGIIETHQGSFYFNHQHSNTQLVIELPLPKPDQKSA